MAKKGKKKTKLKLPLRVLLLVVIIVIFILGISFVIEGVLRNKNNETIYSYAIMQKLNYEVELYKNSIFEEEKIGMNNTYVANVVKSINANFDYEYKNSKSIPLVYDYEVVASVVGEYVLPDEDKKSSLWSKEYVLLEGNSKESSGNIINISDDFVIDYPYFNEIAVNLRNEIKLPITSYISVDVNINITGNVGYKSVNDTRKINMRFPLQQQAFKISNNFDEQYFKEIKLWNDEELSEKVKKEIIGFVLVGLAVCLFIVLFKKIFNIKINNVYNRELNKILRQYGDIVVEINSEVDKKNIQVIDVKTFTELLDLEDELKIPILFYEITADKLGEFTITHNNILYRYVLDNEL